MSQLSTQTHFNRYPELFHTIRARIAQRYGDTLGGGALKILSFGCSSGEEMLTIRSYFPHATIVGCDVHLDALAQARKIAGPAIADVFLSQKQSVRDFGPYDIIFAMSVLCRFPMPASATSLASIYPFDEFDDQISTLIDSLNPNGILCAYNTNYSPRDCARAAGIVPIRSVLTGENGFVDKAAKDGTRLTECVLDPRGHYHRLRSGKAPAPEDFADCIFEKTDGAAIDVPLPELAQPMAALLPKGETTTGHDLEAMAGTVALRRRLRTFAAGDAALWLETAIEKRLPDGSVATVSRFWTPTSAMQQRAWSAEQQQHRDALDAALKARKAPLNRILRHLRIERGFRIPWSVR